MERKEWMLEIGSVLHGDVDPTDHFCWFFFSVKDNLNISAFFLVCFKLFFFPDKVAKKALEDTTKAV